jgi:hypothetical protein
MRWEMDGKWDQDKANVLDRIQTWALEEARRRLEAEGILKEPDSK